MTRYPAVVFLRNAHERAERLARAATPGPWEVDSTTFAESIGSPGRNVVSHIAAHSPDTVLRRIAAERELLAEHAADGPIWPECVRCAKPTREVDASGHLLVTREPLGWPCRTVLLLAQGWGWETAGG